MTVFEIEGLFLLLVTLGLTGVKIFSVASAVTWSTESYHVAGKLTKPAWCAILGLGLVCQIIFASSPLNIINLAFTIAAFVYLADVRPALAGLHRR